MGKSLDYDLASPIFVNIAFAAELYFKCLLYMRHGTLIRGHNLKKLYSSLPKKDKIELEKFYNLRVQNSVLIKDTKKFHPDSNFDLRYVLGDIADTYVNWRYSFEKLPNSTAGIGPLADALQDYIFECAPEFRERLHGHVYY